MSSGKYNHLADMICRKRAEDIPKIACQVSALLPDFDKFICYYYALAQLGDAPVEPQPTGQVYFMRDESNGDIKIGYSGSDVHSRAYSHSLSRQSKITTLLSIPGTYQHENEFHHTYHEHNIEGEWYTGSGAVMDSIDAMKQVADTNVNATTKEFMDAARWALFFYNKEAECYKAILARYS